MKRSNCFKKYICCSAGFSFIEIAIALIIIGMLSGAGLLLLGKTVESSQRKETLQRLQETKRALLLFSENQGKFPLLSSQLPASTPPVYVHYYQKIGSSPVDTWKNSVSYKVSSQNVITPDQYIVCKRLKNPESYTGWIALNDQIEGKNFTETGTGGKAVVALLLSGGARDADGLGNFFDDSNATGAPNYVRKYPAEDFDDIVVAITADEMYGVIRDNYCTTMVTVSDNRVVGDLYYVYNRTTGRDIGSANWLDPALTSLAERTITVKVLLDDQVEIRDASGGGGSVIAANKLLPLPVAPLPVPATITAATTIDLP